MINVSNELYNAMQKNTAFAEHVKITLADGTILNIPDGDIVIQGNKISSGGGTSGIPLGVASGRTVVIELANFHDEYSDYDFFDAEIELKVGYTLPGGETIIPYGVYTVVTPETLGTTISISAVDNMYKADRPFTTALTAPVQAGVLLANVCQTCGIPLQSASFLNDNFVIQELPTECTCRQVIGGIAMIAGGNAFINREGRLEIKTYSMDNADAVLGDQLLFAPWLQSIQANGGAFNPWESGDGDELDGGTYQNMRYGCHILYAWIGNPSVDTDDITITGIATPGDDDEKILYGQEGYILTAENPVVHGVELEAVTKAGQVLNGLKFRAFSGTYIGDPTIEFMDEVIVVDRKGNCYKSFVTDVDYSFRGTTTIKNSAEPVIRNNTVYANNSRVVQRARRIIEGKLSAYDIGIQNLSQLMSMSMGFYYTKEVQNDGSFVFYIHDQPTLAESTYIYKRTANGYAQSTDGGETWNSGVDAMGNAVMNTVAAKGISADWMTTGSLVISDGAYAVFTADVDTGNVLIQAKNIGGNEVFYLNSATGVIRINATEFKLSGQPLGTIIQGEVSSHMTQQEIFDALTNNGIVQGIVLGADGKIYINWEYAEGGALTLGRSLNQAGYLRVLDENDWVSLYADNKKVVVGKHPTQPAYYYDYTRMNGCGFEWYQVTNYDGRTEPFSWHDHDVTDYTKSQLETQFSMKRRGLLSFNDKPSWGTSSTVTGCVLETDTAHMYLVSDYFSFADKSGSHLVEIDSSTVSGIGFGGEVRVKTGGFSVAGLNGGSLFSISQTSAGYKEGTATADTFTVKGDTIATQTEDGLKSYVHMYKSNGSTYVVCNADSSGGFNSDIRLKKNIKPSKDFLEILNKLEVVDFDWDEDKHAPGHISAGFVAQDAEKVLPELVIYDEDNDRYYFQYAMLTPFLVKAVQELTEKTREQEKRIEDLENRLRRLEALLC